MLLDLEAIAAEVVSLVKSALAPVLADVKALQGHVSVWESRWNDLGALRERVAVIEARPPAAPSDPALAELREHIKAFEGRLSGLPPEIAALRERAAVLETRAPVPGPAGQDGTHGRDGKDGADGLGFEDLSVDFDGDRTLALTFERGTLRKSWALPLPFLRYQGVYHDGHTYAAGDVVTWAGSTWHANEVTATKPGDGSKAWTLTVKRGRDGKDGRDAPTALPVVSVGRRP